MKTGALRLAMRIWRRFARRALLVWCIWLAGAEVAIACRSMGVWLSGALPDTVVGMSGQPSGAAPGQVVAYYANLSDRYGHGVLGDALEPVTLGVWTPENSASCGIRLTLDPPHVFEDTAPRLVDLTGDGIAEIITVRSHESLGAQLAIYQLSDDQFSLDLLATTPYIGTRFRWLAPLGAADLDGDGRMEIAYVDRPHLAKTLRIWRFDEGALSEVATFAGVTNHRIGEEDIAGGIRDCGQGPEMILADAAWQSLLALRFDGQQIDLRQIGIGTSRRDFARAMACQN